MPRCRHILIISLSLLLLASCSSEKFLGPDDQLLTSVKLTSATPDVDASAYSLYVRQQPNTKWFNLFKVPLGLYCISSADTTKKSNRFWQRMGQAPVIYSEQQMLNSQNALALALKDKGYLNASVSARTIASTKHRKVKVEYELHPGQPYIIRSINTVADDARIDSLIMASQNDSYLHPGMLCDASLLAKERTRITYMLHNHGYYKALENFIRYEVDTLAGPDNVALTQIYAGMSIAADTALLYTPHTISQVNIEVHNQTNQEEGDSVVITPTDSFSILYTPARHPTFRPRLLTHNTHIRPGQTYREMDVNQTYRSLANLGAISYESIQLVPQDSAQLECNIHVVPNKTNTFGIELEGTNTAGNLGVASSLTFTNRNLFNGSEQLTVRVKGAYEAITGLEGYSDQNYIEFGLETRLSFPRMIMPFSSKNKYRGTSNLSLQYNTQDRPEFHRRVLTALWNYQWTSASGRVRHRLDLPSLNYVYMPWISNTFREEYLQADNYRSALIRYAYEDLLILNFTYSHTYNSTPTTATTTTLRNTRERKTRTNPYQLNWSIESAGNILYALSKPLNLSKNSDDQYTVFDVAYAQYVKFDFDYSKLYILNSANQVALHAAFGIAQPYGNSTIVPFEKRYFAGGANSIRGWSVRELGPGRYMGEDGKVDYINQTGNLKLLFSAELRSELFWKFNGAFFIDAGNIWTTKRYEVTGTGGQFHFDNFWKQIAVSYGLGLRLNLDYFILRLDMGIKAVNPAYSPSERGYLPLIHPRFGRDFTFHFAVGLPF